MKYFGGSNRIYQQISRTLSALETCNQEWQERHEEALGQIMKTAPSGSGIDSGTKLLLEECKPDKLVFQMDFHHMFHVEGDPGEYYDGWTEHKVTVQPCLSFGFQIDISGRDRNQIKDYLYDVFRDWILSSVDREGVLWEEHREGEWRKTYG